MISYLAILGVFIILIISLITVIKLLTWATGKGEEWVKPTEPKRSSMRDFGMSNSKPKPPWWRNRE